MGDDAQRSGSKVDNIAGMVVRRVLLQERKRRHESREAAEADHPRRPEATLYVALEVHHVPAHGMAADADRSHGRETYRRILGGKVLRAMNS